MQNKALRIFIVLLYLYIIKGKNIFISKSYVNHR